MNRKEWQKHYGFNDKSMADIDLVLKFFNGKITKIEGKKCLSG